MLEITTDRSLMGTGSILYGIAFGIALFCMLRGRDVFRIVFMPIMAMGFICQSIGLYFRGVNISAFPLSNTFEILQVLAWAAVALNLVLRQIFKLNLLNFFSSGLGAVLSITAISIPSWDFVRVASSVSGSPWVGFHAALAIFSYSVFGILAITSVMYLIQNYGLQNLRSGNLFARLPAIRQLEEINTKLIILGVSILTIAVGIGFLNWLVNPGTVGLLKLAVAISVWSAYLITLFLRKKNRLVATSFAQTCVVLFLVALVSLWPLTYKSAPEDTSKTKEVHGQQ